MPSLFQSYFTHHTFLQPYKDPTFRGTHSEYTHLLTTSTTLYVGCLSLTVSEERVWALFSLVGKIKRVIMGINKDTKLPCGFCFVEYWERCDAENAVVLINGLRVDGVHVKVDIDYGYMEMREYGRKEKKMGTGKRRREG